MDERLDIYMTDLPDEFRAVAEVIGLEAALKLVSAYGGESLYIVKPETAAREARNRAIREAFDGANYREIARCHGLTVTMVRRIVEEGRGPRQKQLGMFDLKENEI